MYNLRITPCQPPLQWALLSAIDLSMKTAAEIRSIRAYLRETQPEFIARFPKDLKLSRFDVVYWEKWGIADAPEIETILAELKA